MNAKRTLRDILVATTGGAVLRVLTALIPALSVENIATAVGIEILNSLVVQVIVVALGIFLVILFVRRMFERRRDQRKPNPGPPLAVVGGQIRDVIWGGFIHKYGVMWRARYGAKRAGGKGVKIEGPFCPQCGTELNSGEINRLIRGEAEAWLCPDCQAEYVRPAETYQDERDNVEKICEKVVGRAEQEGIDVIDERDDFQTEEWNGGSGIHRSHRRSY